MHAYRKFVIDIITLERWLVDMYRLMAKDDKEIIDPRKEVTRFLHRYVPDHNWYNIYDKYILPTKRVDKITKLELIQYYKAQGYTRHQIHKATGISPNTVYKYFDNPLATRHYQYDPILEKAIKDWEKLRKYLASPKGISMVVKRIK